jgi:prophage regulatory protein
MGAHARRTEWSIDEMTTLLRLPEVERRTGHSKGAIYAGMNAGTFPRNVKIGSRAVGWPEDEIDQYIATKIAARRNPEGHYVKGSQEFAED